MYICACMYVYSHVYLRMHIYMFVRVTYAYSTYTLTMPLLYVYDIYVCVYSVQFITETLVSVKRIQNLLLLNENDIFNQANRSINEQDQASDVNLHAHSNAKAKGSFLSMFGSPRAQPGAQRPSANKPDEVAPAGNSSRPSDIGAIWLDNITASWTGSMDQIPSSSSTGPHDTQRVTNPTPDVGEVETKQSRDDGEKKATGSPVESELADAALARATMALSPPSTHTGVLTLSSVDLRVAAGEFIVVVGPVGASKSSLLLAILGELQLLWGWIAFGPSASILKEGNTLESNSIIVDKPCYPRMAYCAQEPWILSTTVSTVPPLHKYIILLCLLMYICVVLSYVFRCGTISYSVRSITRPALLQ